MGRQPVGRSLDPLPGEDLGGYLLRLSARLGLSPINLARSLECIVPPATRIRRRLLIDLDTRAFALVARLAQSEARALTLSDWAVRYPAIARSARHGARYTAPDGWLFNDEIRYCPHCLAGDGSEIQRQYGGPWKKIWQLPVAFVCLEHEVFLQDGCGAIHARPAALPLITNPAAQGLHPAQCRLPRPGHHERDRRGLPPCGIRVDRFSAGLPHPSPAALQAQRRILTCLEPDYPPRIAAAFFTDLRLLTALLYSSWPAGLDLLDPVTGAEVDEYIRRRGPARKGILDGPPKRVTVSAGLFTAAISMLDSPDLRKATARHLKASSASSKRTFTGAPFVNMYERHQSSCSAALRRAVEPATHAYRFKDGIKAPARATSYRAEHIPAFLEQHWFRQHLESLKCEPHNRTLRRLVAAQLVQRAVGGSLGSAGHYLGFIRRDRQYGIGPDLLSRLDEAGHERFTAAVDNLARDLDDSTNLVDYERRREALRDWCLTADEWRDICSRLPPALPQTGLADRKRQEASAYVWALVTQGEYCFAPRPIEAAQHSDIRDKWRQQRGAIGFQFHRPDPTPHYSALRELLRPYADHLAAAIDNGWR